MQLAVYALSAGVAVGWAAATVWEPGAGPLAVGVLAGIVAGFVATASLSVHPLQLFWDGTAWRLQGQGREAQTGQVALMLDLGPWMLVRFSVAGTSRRAPGTAVWLPFSRRDAAAAWPALRVALHAAQPAA